MKEPIIFITKAYHHYETIRDVLQKHALNYPVYYGKDSESCLEIARELVEKGAKVLEEFISEYRKNRVEQQ